MAKYYLKMAVPHKGEFLIFSPGEVEYFEADNNYCKVYCYGVAGFYLAPVSMKAVSGKISGTLFCRVHKQYIVSLKYVVKLNWAKTRLCVKGGRWLPVGPRYQEGLLERLGMLK